MVFLFAHGGDLGTNPLMRSFRQFIRLAGYVAICGVAAMAAGTAQVQDHQYSAAEIQAGSRLYATQCQQCHGQMGDQISGINLRRGQFRRVTSDDDIRRIVATGITESGMPPFKFQPAELDSIIAFIRAGFDPGGTAVRIGDAQRGRAVYEGKGQCSSCHRVNGVGSRVAPDLSDIGSARQPTALHRSLIEPTKGMWPINRPIRIVTRDGRTVSGRRLNEDTFTIQLIDANERLVAIDKSEIKQYEKAAASTMPSVAGKLSGDEIADLVAYLLSLKG
jgi:cytochrome c oxidase cbb3-type subunit 3